MLSNNTLLGSAHPRLGDRIARPAGLDSPTGCSLRPLNVWVGEHFWTLAQAGDLVLTRPGAHKRTLLHGRRYRGVASGSLPKERLRMAIGIRIKLAGVTQEQFDQAHDHANPDRTPPKGLLFHASGPIDDGWGIIDFWESRADFDAFSGRIVEGMTATGIQPQGPPDIKEFPVHEMVHA
jgi:hypothetical protein